MEVLKTAHKLGVICLNYTEVTEFIYSGEGQIHGAELCNKLTEKYYPVKAHCVINATGPWSTHVMQKDRPDKQPALIHTKGVHLVVPFQKLPLKQSVYFDIPGGRMLFAIPRNEITYLGTTDTPFSGELENPQVTTEDATYILEQINQMFPHKKLTLSDIVSSWAGVRVLLYEAGKKPSEISRKDEIFVSESGLITVAGGKLTGYRKLAEQVVNKAIQLQFPKNKKPSATKKLKLSGGTFENVAAVKSLISKLTEAGRPHGFLPTVIIYLVRTYGTHAEQIVAEAIRLKAGGLAPQTCLLQAEIYYTIRQEGVTNICDYLIRRTGKLYFDRDKIEEILPEVIAAFQTFLRWDEVTTQKYVEAFKTLFEEAIAFRKPD
jgi:glycerol-3-phosphate dehydrogenase